MTSLAVLLPVALLLLAGPLVAFAAEPQPPAAARPPLGISGILPDLAVASDEVPGSECGIGAHWIRLTADHDCTATAWLIYN